MKLPNGDALPWEGRGAKGLSNGWFFVETLTILFKVAGGVFLLANFVWFPLMMRRVERTNKNLKQLSAEGLQELATRKPAFHCVPVVRELKSRGEEASFALPLLLKMALDRRYVMRLFGWAGLKEHFAAKLPDIDFSKPKPTAQERAWMQALLDELEE